MSLSILTTRSYENNIHEKMQVGVGGNNWWSGKVGGVWVCEGEEVLPTMYWIVDILCFFTYHHQCADIWHGTWTDWLAELSYVRKTNRILLVDLNLGENDGGFFRFGFWKEQKPVSGSRIQFVPLPGIFYDKYTSEILDQILTRLV